MTATKWGRAKILEGEKGVKERAFRKMTTHGKRFCLNREKVTKWQEKKKNILSNRTVGAA